MAKKMDVPARIMTLARAEIDDAPFSSCGISTYIRASKSRTRISSSIPGNSTVPVLLKG